MMMMLLPMTLLLLVLLLKQLPLLTVMMQQRLIAAPLHAHPVPLPPLLQQETTTLRKRGRVTCVAIPNKDVRCMRCDA